MAAPGPQTPVSQAEGGRYEVLLLTMEPGDEVWELFGHNAILIRDRLLGQDIAWNWGLFDFEQVDFLPRFLRGEMLYSMGPADPVPFIAAYERANRTVHAHEIFLTDAEAAALDALVRTNFLPENRDYIYHYFLDNCSTRIRDALDSVLGGLLYERFAARETPETFRWHARRLVSVVGWVDQGLSFLLGTRGDRAITEWEAMYVPMELMVLLEGVERVDATGVSRPLLGPRQVMFEADREPTPTAPPPFNALWAVLGMALAGTLGGLGFAGLGLSGPSGPGARGAGTRALLAGADSPQEGPRGGPRGGPGGIAALAFLAGVVAWGVLAGALGLLLVLAWFTDHDFIHRNLNLFHMSPLALLLAPAMLAAVLGRGRFAFDAGRVATGLAVAIAALSVATALLQLTPLLHQGNAEVIAVALPVNLALGWVMLRFRSATAGQLP